MDDAASQPGDLSPPAPTLDASSASIAGPDVSVELSPSWGHCGPVALVAGSGHGLTRETQRLLQRRLRLAAGVMFFASLVFLPQHWFRADFTIPGSKFVFGFHVGITIMLAVACGMLCRRRAYSMSRLRLLEVALFGLCAAFLAALEYQVLLDHCRQLVQVQEATGHMPDRLSPRAGFWLLMIFTYSLFIPNTWRRAAVVIAMLAAVPIVMILAMTSVYPEVRQALPVGAETEFILIMVVAAVIGLFGVDTIGSLRREAYEARQFGQYRLTRMIGAGGMGEVYLAEHQLMKRPCVVKLIRPDRAGDAKALARFQREVRATAKLSHWNTVEIFDYGSTEDGTFYYVMEYLPGMSLHELVEQFGPMPPGRVIHFLRQTCDALQEAHAAGLVHRDIKPGNIFAAQRGNVYDVTKLLDFGLVKAVAEEQPIHLTAEGSLTGSPLFMSPEQAAGDGAPDARSDIYSLGAVGYYLLTARPPFESDKPIKVILAHATEAVVPPSQLRAEVPDDLEEVILRCLAKSPADRFQDAGSLGDALAACRAADEWSRQRAMQWWQQQQPLDLQPARTEAHPDESSGIAVSRRTQTPYNGS